MRLEPTVLVVGGVEVVMKSINKKNMLANKKKRNKKNLPGETRLIHCSHGCGKMGGGL